MSKPHPSHAANRTIHWRRSMSSTDSYLLGGVGGREHPAVGEMQFGHKTGGRSVLGRECLDGDNLTGLERTIGARQPGVLQRGRARELERPVLHRPFVILRIEADI